MTARSFSPQGQWPHSLLLSLSLSFLKFGTLIALSAPEEKQQRRENFRITRRRKTPSQLLRPLMEEETAFRTGFLMI